ncbi:RDD family protein [Eikenella sp. Marseille-P7795]|uniref:RDD family protein n=1 Tax=Eikenella sp. Marseille-P7795 TaxID=2866577 RepID=UPI001CE48D1E|nr:RDD family protein [Eikenella sp. Marseille-P7795]
MSKLQSDEQGNISNSRIIVMQPVGNQDSRELELATPGLRLISGLLDRLLFVIFGFSFLATLSQAVLAMGSSGDTVVMAMVVTGILLVPWTILELIFMSIKGQSIGQMIIDIKVIAENGESPGFLRYVLVREVAFAFLLKVITYPIAKYCGWPFIFIIPASIYFICFVMMYNKKRNRQTLQDMIAGTFVVFT